MTPFSPKRNGNVLRVAAAQIEATPCDIEGNLAKHLHYVDEARHQNVDLLVFPELSLTGYHVGERALDVAMFRTDPRLLQIAERAESTSVILGFVEEGPAAQFHNACAVLRNGKVEFVHRKLNLATYGNLEEDKYFAEGRYVDVCDLCDAWRVAILICADAWNPGLVHLAALYGATILVTPVASSTEAVGGEFSNPHGWEIAISFYAMMYGMPVVMVNLCGADNGRSYWGGSRIVDVRGKMIAQAGPEEEMIVTEINYEAVRKARFQLPTVRDSNLDLIHREVERLANRIGVPRGARSP